MKVFFVFVLFSILLLTWLIPATDPVPVAISTPASISVESLVSLKNPPVSLEEWYKPANKRQVWLHTMFRLRREMQAISDYAKQPDSITDNKVTMLKWFKRLDKDYNKIAEMVPEWQDAIKPKLLPDLEMFIEEGDMTRVGKTLKMIQRTCDDCHTYYQPLVTAIYRSPYYDDLAIKSSAANLKGKTQSFDDNMDQLSKSVNRVLIALDDGHNAVAQQSARMLSEQLQDLGGTCSSCHKDDEYPRERILGVATQQRFEQLYKNINAGQVKDSQKMMGEIAVTVCARCHNTHRIVSDLRDSLLPEE